MSDDPLEALADALPTRPITIFKIDIGGKKERYGVMYEGAEVKDGITYMSEFGDGYNIMDAANSYIKKISGRTLVWDAGTDKEETAKVVILQRTRYLGI